MKTLFLFMFTGVLTFAQNDTLLEALKYYPLQEGNHWEYLSHFWNYIPYYEDTTFFSIDVTGDTILSNNKSYKILHWKNITPNAPGYRVYERIDSVTACLYRFTNDTAFIDHEYLCDSLFAAVGDTFAGAYGGFNPMPEYLSTIYDGEYNGQVLGFFTSVKEFQEQSWIPVFSYSFAKDLGYLYSYTCEGGCNETKLVYAKIDSAEYGTQVTDVKDANNIFPQQFVLYQNYPNPFNPSTTLSFVIGNSAFVTLKVYDVLGNEIAALVNEEKPAGRYNFKFDGSNLASGIYFYVLRAGDLVQSRKMLLLK